MFYFFDGHSSQSYIVYFLVKFDNSLVRLDNFKISRLEIAKMEHAITQIGHGILSCVLPLFFNLELVPSHSLNDIGPIDNSKVHESTVESAVPLVVIATRRDLVRQPMEDPVASWLLGTMVVGLAGT